MGNPKAAMLSHDNFTWDAFASIDYIEATMEKEVIVSFLPLSHVAAQVSHRINTVSFSNCKNRKRNKKLLLKNEEISGRKAHKHMGAYCIVLKGWSLLPNTLQPFQDLLLGHEYAD